MQLFLNKKRLIYKGGILYKMKELIKQAKKGNKEAFTKLIELNLPKLYKIARAKLSEELDIEDVIQETLMKAYLNLNRLKSVDKFSLWLTKILVNECNNIYRKSKVIHIQYDDYVIPVNVEYENALDNEMMYSKIMNLLEPEDRIIMVLYYSNGYTTKQISEIININENTIKGRLKRAKENLREKLEGGI